MIELIENSIKKNWDRKAFTDFNGESLQYKDVARKIAKMHLLFEAADIRPGDKIALCGRNSGNWCVAFLATITYGAVIVPILHEFKPDNVHHIVNHSEARLLFVGDQVWENLNENRMPALQGIICVKDFTLVNSRSEKLSFARKHLNALFGQRFPMMFLREHVHFVPESSPEQLAVINYTSGTTGFSKGVMLPYRSLMSNVLFCNRTIGIAPGDNIVSMLPMGHVFGLVYDFLYGVCFGAHLYFLTRMPSPKVIMTTVAAIHPRILSCVPLVIEKIFKTELTNMGTLLIDSAVKVVIMLGYFVFCASVKDVRRVFMYHGAEHKTINCFEAEKELTVENVRPCTRLHKRCGTSFLLFVMLISMIVFFFVRTDVFWLRLITRICLVPFIAGISYEVIRWAGNSESSFVKIVSAPGLCLQKLTTAEPDASQIECAIAAMKGVLEDEPEE